MNGYSFCSGESGEKSKFQGRILKTTILYYVRLWEMKFSCGRFDSVIQQEEWRAMKKIINLYNQPLIPIPISYFKMSDADTEA